MMLTNLGGIIGKYIFHCDCRTIFESIMILNLSAKNISIGQKTKVENTRIPAKHKNKQHECGLLLK